VQCQQSWAREEGSVGAALQPVPSSATPMREERPLTEGGTLVSMEPRAPK